MKLGILLSLALTASLSQASSASACTRVLWNDAGVPVTVGRSMDWPQSTDPKIWVLPQGIDRQGGVPENPAKWTSRYGSVVTSVYDLGAADGFNEKGLAAHLLFLRATDFGPRDPAKPGFLAGLWVQYALDNFTTVAEAVDGLKKVQPVMQEHEGFKATVHLALEDSTGDSAIFEYIDGKLTIHHGRNYTVMTNDPPYDQQLASLKKYNFSNPTAMTPLPGNVNPTDRFVRATYFRNLLKPTAKATEASSSILAIIRNVSVPFDAPYSSDARFSVYNTEYRTLSDLSNLRYIWEYTRSPNVIWMETKNFNFQKGAPVKWIDPRSPELSGDISAKFAAVPKAPF